jgi:hypothetical protein
MRRTHQLRLSLQVTLAANFYFRPFTEERGYVSKLRQLLAAGPLHDRVAIDTRHAARGVGAGFPIILNAPLMAGETGQVLHFGRFAGILAKRYEATDPFAAAGSDVVAARPVAILASAPFTFITRIE